MGITADFSGAFAKTRALAATPQAARLQATLWAAETVVDLKASAAAMQKSWYPGQKKGQLARSVDFEVKSAGAETWQIKVGTGLKGSLESKYAKIQDVGGVTHPRVTPRMRAWAWHMAYQGARERGTKLFRATFKRAGAGLAKTAGRQAHERSFGMYKAIALTDKATLTVHVPASHWFTSVVEGREAELREMMSPEVIFNLASQISGGKG